jgi:hypothetical protein
MKAIWDEAFLKQHERNLREDALAVQSDEDWERAVLRLERGMSNISDGFLDCRLPACRRAHRCVGNKPICMPRCKVELVPGGEQECVEEFYADIQRERRDAAAANREPRLMRVMKDRVHVEADEIEDQPPVRPAEGELERNMAIARQALRGDDMPSLRSPQPQPRKPEPPAAPLPVAPVAAMPPEAPVAPGGPHSARPVGTDNLAGDGRADQPNLGRLCCRETDAATQATHPFAVGRSSMERAAGVEGSEVTAH